MLAGPRYNIVSILWWHISPPKSLSNLHPKLQSVLFQKEKPIILQIYFSTKKTKKTTTTPKKYKVWFLNSQSMDFKIETYKSSKLLLYKREKKDKCGKYVFWKYKVWFLNYKLYFLKIQSMVFRKSVQRTRCLFFKIRGGENLRIYSPPSPKTHIEN